MVSPPVPVNNPRGSPPPRTPNDPQYCQTYRVPSSSTISLLALFSVIQGLLNARRWNCCFFLFFLFFVLFCERKWWSGESWFLWSTVWAVELRKLDLMGCWGEREKAGEFVAGHAFIDFYDQFHYSNEGFILCAQRNLLARFLTAWHVRSTALSARDFWAVELHSSIEALSLAPPVMFCLDIRIYPSSLTFCIERYTIPSPSQCTYSPAFAAKMERIRPSVKDGSAARTR